MVEKLDLKDKKILYLLLENSRLSPGEIAKHVGLSKNAVAYRIDRLVKKGIIWKFFAAVDHQKIGIYSYDVFLKLKATPEQMEKIRGHFRKHPNIVWATTLFGKWDLFVEILTKDLNEFEQIFDRIVEFLGDQLEYYDSKLFVKRLKIDHQIYDFKLGYKFKPRKPDYSRVFRLDELDKKILSYLNEHDALAPYQKIGQSVGASLETTRNRVNRLINEGVIVRFFPFVMLTQKLGFLKYLVTIDFRYLTKELEDEVAEYINNMPEVHLLFKTVGKPQMYFWAIVEQPSEVEDLVKKLRNKFYQIIIDTEAMLTTEELTLNFFPKGIWSFDCKTS
jgi:DNA-binding Lrp family transcriptional regulator